MAQAPQPRNLHQLVAARVAAWNQAHPDQPIDPQAALAVAAQEGLGGGIGDGGHAFGPFQLNNAGGVLTGKFAGLSPEQIQAWAASPAGVDYALGGIAKVAGGLKGRAAVTNIVSRFERPANIPGETARALTAYGLPVGPGAAAGTGPGVPSTPAVSPLVQAAAGSQAPAVAPAPQIDYQPLLAQHLAAAAATPTNDLRGFYSTLQAALKQRQSTAATPGGLNR